MNAAISTAAPIIGILVLYAVIVLTRRPRRDEQPEHRVPTPAEREAAWELRRGAARAADAMNRTRTRQLVDEYTARRVRDKFQPRLPGPVFHLSDAGDFELMHGEASGDIE